MKIPIAIYFVIFFVYSKCLEPKIFQSIMDSKNSVCKPETKDQCLNTPPGIYDSYLQCCRVGLKSNVLDQFSVDECLPMPKLLDFCADAIAKKEFKAISKELLGFFLTSMNLDSILNMINFNGNVNCKNKDLNFSLGDQYTQEDINTFKSEDYCLNYFYQNVQGKNNKQFDCKKGKVLESSKKEGFSCGTLQIKINFKCENATDFEYDTCILTNMDYYKSILFNEQMQQYIDLVNKYGKDEVNSLYIRLSDSDGNAIKYDIMEGKIVESSNILTISKYLLLFAFILF